MNRHIKLSSRLLWCYVDVGRGIEPADRMASMIVLVGIAGCDALVYASGSGVYGDTGELAVGEDYAPMLPISPYGASKLACEAMIHAYVHIGTVVK